MIQFVYTQAIERNYVNPDWYDWMGLGNADVRPERATQWDVGWERQVGKDTALSVTPFYRQFNDMLQVRSLDPSDPNGYPQTFENLGGGISRGIEFQMRKRPSNNWSGWLSYTLSSAKAQASNDRQAITSTEMNYVDWDQRHTVVGVMNLMRDKWMYSFMGEYGSGLPYTLATDTTPNSRRVSSHMLFNVNVSREVKGGWLPQGTMSFSIANLFNSHSVLSKDGDGEPLVRVQPRFLSLSFARPF
jgi:outer membrane receptor protein involved in Fe transport